MLPILTSKHADGAVPLNTRYSPRCSLIILTKARTYQSAPNLPRLRAEVYQYTASTRDSTFQHLSFLQPRACILVGTPVPTIKACTYARWTHSVALVQQRVDEVDHVAACARLAGGGRQLAGLERAEQLLQDLTHVGRQHDIIGVQHWSRLLQPL